MRYEIFVRIKEIIGHKKRILREAKKNRERTEPDDIEIPKSISLTAEHGQNQESGRLKKCIQFKDKCFHWQYCSTTTTQQMICVLY